MDELIKFKVYSNNEKFDEILIDPKKDITFTKKKKKDFLDDDMTITINKGSTLAGFFKKVK